MKFTVTVKQSYHYYRSLEVDAEDSTKAEELAEDLTEQYGFDWGDPEFGEFRIINTEPVRD